MESESEINKATPAPSWHCVNGMLYMGPPAKVQQTNEHVSSVPNNVMYMLILYESTYYWFGLGNWSFFQVRV